MTDTPIRTMGGFADARDHRHEALTSRTYGRALLAEAFELARLLLGDGAG